MGKSIWWEIEKLYQEFQRLGIDQSVDYEEYYLYSLITHSTTIEGSILTETDTQPLFDEGVATKGKPLVYRLMNKNLKNAHELTKEESVQGVDTTSSLLQELNAILVRTTGSVHSTIGGSFDFPEGEFHLRGVTTDIGARSYMSYQKVSTKVGESCSILREWQELMNTLRKQYELSFNARLNLVTVHLWASGNSRATHLLMNYIQFCYRLFPAKILKEDRADYILSSQQSQDKETNQPFLSFIATQLRKSLSLEIEGDHAFRERGFGFMF